jgi:RES domain
VTAGHTETPEPPSPFKPQEIRLAAGTRIHRVYDNRFEATQFNPGPKGGGRFHFFGNPQVPVLYTAETQEAAVAETLLRNIPVTGGLLAYGDYKSKVMASLTIRREIRLASFLGTGLRALRVEARQLTDTAGESYPKTRKWAEAAHRAGYEGLAWMSRRNNSDRAYVFFGDRVESNDLDVVPESGKIFALGPGQDWLIDLCGPMHIDVMPPAALSP